MVGKRQPNFTRDYLKLWNAIWEQKISPDGRTCMLQLIFIKPNGQISPESCDITKWICCCLYMSIHYLFAFGAGIETLLEENIVKLDTDVLEEAFLLWIGIVSSTGNHAVLCYSWMSTEWIFCFLSWDSILDSILNNLFLMSLKKHLLYNLNWSCFEHAVACGNLTMLCCVTAAYLKIIEKAACFLSCETRSLT